MNNPTHTETSAVQAARKNIVKDYYEAMTAYRSTDRKERYEDVRKKILSSNATHFFLREILNKCEHRDTIDNINNLEVALRLMKMKLGTESYK